MALKRKRKQYFDDDKAMALYRANRITELIEYSIPCVQARLSQAKQRLPSNTSWDDLEATYYLYLVQAIQRYKPKYYSKKWDHIIYVKLYTHITNYLHYAEKNYIRREMKYINHNVQLQ